MAWVLEYLRGGGRVVESPWFGIYYEPPTVPPCRVSVSTLEALHRRRLIAPKLENGRRVYRPTPSDGGTPDA